MLYNRAQYYGEISFIDDCIGKIVATLEQLRIRENTLIVFCSDHGDLLGDHLFWYKGYYHFHQCARTPWIVNWPRRVRAGKQVDGITQQIDLFPALAALVSLPVPAGIQGRSQLPVLTSDASDTGYTSALIEFLFRGVSSADASDNWQAHELCSLITPEWRLSHYLGSPFGELYDLTADPNELDNVWALGKYAEIRQQLRDELLDRLMQVHDPLPIRTESY